MSTPHQLALRRADRVRRGEIAILAGRSLRARRRNVVVGDPQTTFERFLRVMEANHLLDATGALRADVTLLAVGDYFDFRPPSGWTAARAGVEGVRILAWLASHDPDQVGLLLGNHDVARVMELHGFDDREFAAAQAEAAEIARLPRAEQGDADKRFRRRWTAVPDSGVVRRDFASFSVEQREIVTRLLDQRRVALAVVAEWSGRPAVVTHAGVTTRELDLLDAAADASEVASRLNRLLAAAAERWKIARADGRGAPLDLSPIHVAGVAGREGGGLLYHRPAYRRDGDPRFVGDARRRFDPRDLPVGLRQVCGHVGHDKCMTELAGFDLDQARDLAPGALRGLTVTSDRRVRYHGPTPGSDHDATLVLIDGSMNRTEPRDYRVLEVDGFVADP